MWDDLDLNLLSALEVFLDERSVTRAAKRLHLSVSATSRLLDRIRRQFDDPILVRSGRGLVPTPRAEALYERVDRLLAEARVLARGETEVDPGRLKRDFMVVASEAVLSFLAGPLVAHLEECAPGVRCAFLTDGREWLLRNPTGADLVIRAVRVHEPEVLMESILTDRMVGVCRADHPILSGEITMDRYLAVRHVVNSRQGGFNSSIDSELGIQRNVLASAPIAMALWVLLSTDLVGACYEQMERSIVAALGLATFEIPGPLKPVEVWQAWHPRHDSDPVHKWLRATIRSVAQELIVEN